jgi:gamma-glutamyltranspeptidase/glutathione hydrolase
MPSDRSAVVSGGHDLTCQTALEVMKAGGNAVDASIAALAMMFIAEPAMASPGAGGFASVKFAGQKARSFDFFCQTPMEKKPMERVHYEEVIVDFGDDQETFYAGNASTAVPGTIAGMYALQEEFGTMGMKELFEPAILKMKEGVALNQFQQYDLSLLEKIFLLHERGQAIFGKEGRIKSVGETIKMPELADFMEILAIEGPDLFYQGEIAALVDQIHKEQGGLLSRKDFEDYKVERSAGRTFHFRQTQISTVGAPFLGGMILETILSHFKSLDTQREKRIHDLANLFHKVAKIQKEEASLTNALKTGRLPLPNKRGATSHFSIIDPSGNAVSLTISLGEGSGLFLPGSQIHLNNMLGELALLPGDLHSWVPGRRLNSMMTPVILEMKNGDLLVLGTGGAGRIPYVLSSYIIDFLSSYPQVNLDTINKFPRIHATPHTLHAEYPLDIQSIPFEGEKKQWKGHSLFFGGVNAVYKTGDRYFASADQRREGHIAIMNH